jgi:hypothetical protein
MMRDSEQKMVELKERPTERSAPTRRTTPAAGCFGYTQPNRKPEPCEVSDPSIFAALFIKSL